MNQDALLALLTQDPVSPEEQEFRDWVKATVTLLTDRTPDEVAYIALANGFKKEIVYHVLSTFRDAMNGTRLENRIAFEAFRLDAAIEDFQRVRKEKETVKELDLMPLWKDLHYYQTGEESNG